MPRANKTEKVKRAVAQASKVGLVGRARAEAKSLVKDARRVGEGVQKRAEKAVANFERRAEKLIGTIEVKAIKAVEPVLTKTFATRRELRDLREIVNTLARRIEELARRSAA